jgi:hypothetical protein
MNSQEQNSLHSIEEQEKKTLEHNLSLTPEQRVINHQKALNLMTALQEARKELDAERS